MQLASNLGASNNASASVGLGLLALNMFGTSTNDKIIFSTVAKFYNKGDEKNVNNISILHPQPKEFYGIWDIQEKYIVKETTLYSAFTRMEKNGYITSFPGVGENGGKKRTYYQITDEGRLYYESKCKEWALTKEVIEKFIVKEN